MNLRKLKMILDQDTSLSPKIKYIILEQQSQLDALYEALNETAASVLHIAEHIDAALNTALAQDVNKQREKQQQGVDVSSVPISDEPED